MITASDLELRAGSRILLSGTSLRVQPGDRMEVEIEGLGILSSPVAATGG